MSLKAIAAAFRAAADALEAHIEADVEKVEAAVVKTVKRAKTSTAAPESAPPAAAPASTAATAPAPVQPAPSPAAPTISKDQLNKAVLAVAGVNREAAVKILGKHGVTNTATLPVEKYQAVFDDFEEEKARLDAAAAQASLV